MEVLGLLALALCLAFTYTLTLPIDLENVLSEQNNFDDVNDFRNGDLLSKQVLKNIIRSALQHGIKKKSSVFTLRNDEPLEQLKGLRNEGFDSLYMNLPTELFPESARAKRGCGGMLSPWQEYICKNK